MHTYLTLLMTDRSRHLVISVAGPLREERIRGSNSGSIAPSWTACSATNASYNNMTSSHGIFLTRGGLYYCIHKVYGAVQHIGRKTADQPVRVKVVRTVSSSSCHPLRVITSATIGQTMMPTSCTVQYIGAPTSPFPFDNLNRK